MKKSVSIVYGVLLVIGFILMALSFAFAGKKNTSFAEDSRRIELQPDRVVEVGEDVREYYFDSNQMQSEFSELTFLAYISVWKCMRTTSRFIRWKRAVRCSGGRPEPDGIRSSCRRA